MKIAILSGKGGSGKTLLAVNLAALVETSIYMDCDVEEPNGHLFFRPNIDQERTVNIQVPVVDAQICDGCGECVAFCKFNALAYTGQLLIFEELCHACEGCFRVCPKQALHPKEKTIGVIKKGHKDKAIIVSGFLNPGQASGTPIIQAMQPYLATDKLIFIDCPPGAACVVMDSIKEADYCVLVAEPSIFGQANLALVHELVRLFKKPHGVVLNKVGTHQNPSYQYCVEHSLSILGSIPFDRVISTLHGEGQLLVKQAPWYRTLFANILDKIISEVEA